MCSHKPLNSLNRIDEVRGKVRKTSITDYDQERYGVPHDRSQLVRCVADAKVVRDRDPLILSAVLQPLLIRSVRREQITMTFHGETSRREDRWKLLPEIAIGEEDPAHAARS